MCDVSSAPSALPAEEAELEVEESELEVPDALCSWLDEFCVVEDGSPPRRFSTPELPQPCAREATLPFEVFADGEGWVHSAARSLDKNGFCVLRVADRSRPLVPDARGDACQRYVQRRLTSLMRAVRERGVDPKMDRFTYSELCARTLRGRRPDMRLPHQPHDHSNNPPEWASLLASVDHWVRPVLETSTLCTAGPEGIQVDSAGCVTALPGAPEQHFHPDGTVKGLVNVFVPLVRVDAANGPTELRLGTHEAAGDERGSNGAWDVDHGDTLAAAPNLEPGELLLFDYRVMHRGRANATAESRPVIYVVYAARPGISDAHNFPNDEWLYESSKVELFG